MMRFPFAGWRAFACLVLLALPVAA